MNAQHKQLMDALIKTGLPTLTANTIASQILAGTLNQKGVDTLAKAIAK